LFILSSFKLIELFPDSLQIKTVDIPLKGVINKAFKAAQESEYFRDKASSNDVKSSLLGKNQDLRFNYDFVKTPDLKDR